MASLHQYCEHEEVHPPGQRRRIEELRHDFQLDTLVQAQEPRDAIHAPSTCRIDVDRIGVVAELSSQPIIQLSKLDAYLGFRDPAGSSDFGGCRRATFQFMKHQPDALAHPAAISARRR